MKNLSKRSKIIRAVVGLVVVAVVAIAVFAQVGGGELLGTTVLAVTPGTPSIYISQVLTLKVNSTFKCDWASSDPTTVSFVGDRSEVKQVTIRGNASGKATILASCGFGSWNVNHVTTWVEVKNRSVDVGIESTTPKLFYTPTGLAGQWSLDDMGMVKFDAPGGLTTSPVSGASVNIVGVVPHGESKVTITFADGSSTYFYARTCDGMDRTWCTQ